MNVLQVLSLEHPQYALMNLGLLDHYTTEKGPNGSTVTVDNRPLKTKYHVQEKDGSYQDGTTGPFRTSMSGTAQRDSGGTGMHNTQIKKKGRSTQGAGVDGNGNLQMGTTRMLVMLI